jgi:hypothetical protein
VPAPSTLGYMAESSLPEYADLLAEVEDIWRVLADPHIEPRPGSLAAEELRAAQEQPCPAGTWGEKPVREAYALAVLNYQVALDHAAAIAALTREPHSAVSASVLARALAEAASQAWWLLEPGIGHVKRVARPVALRYRSACEGEKAATADGVPADEHPGYTETTAQVEQYAHALDLGRPSVDRSKPWTVYVCGTERLPTASWRIKELFSGIDLPSIYPVFSGYSHGELFALLRDFELLTHGDLGMHYRAVVNEESFKGAVAVASYALYPPGERLSKLFGLDDARAPTSPATTV